MAALQTICWFNTGVTGYVSTVSSREAWEFNYRDTDYSFIKDVCNEKVLK